MAASLCAAPPLATTASTSAGAGNYAGQSSTRPYGLSLPRAPPTCDEEAVATTLLTELADIATSPQSPLMKAISAWPEFSAMTSSSQSRDDAFLGAALRCFLRGTLLMIGGEWKQAEDMKSLSTDLDVGGPGSDGAVRLRLVQAVLRHSSDGQDGGDDRVVATFENVADGRQLVADCERAHPFLVDSKGWASFGPHAATLRYGLSTCQSLSPGDVCVPPASQTTEVFGAALNSDGWGPFSFGFFLFEL